MWQTVLTKLFTGLMWAIIFFAFAAAFKWAVKDIVDFFLKDDKK